MEFNKTYTIVETKRDELMTTVSEFIDTMDAFSKFNHVYKYKIIIEKTNSGWIATINVTNGNRLKTGKA